MPSEVETFRELARAFWAGKETRCPKHPGALLVGSFVQTTYADHIFLTCARGKETLTIGQRPKQMEFFDQQVEGYVENLQRGDAIRCYRCQSKMETDARENGETGVTDYTFTCIRCFSWGRWVGKPELAKIGKD
jgi:DNA-directed RNA polymerase subunit RPC12/RpoP